MYGLMSVRKTMFLLLSLYYYKYNIIYTFVSYNLFKKYASKDKIS